MLRGDIGASQVKERQMGVKNLMGVNEGLSGR